MKNNYFQLLISDSEEPKNWVKYSEYADLNYGSHFLYREWSNQILMGSTENWTRVEIFKKT